MQEYPKEMYRNNHYRVCHGLDEQPQGEEPYDVMSSAMLVGTVRWVCRVPDTRASS